MKIQFSLPKDNAFFNRYATLIPTLSKLGMVAQLISGITEIGIIYAVFYARLTDFMPDYAFHVAYVGALLGTLFLEIGLRKFTPYSIRAFLYKRFSGLDLAMTVVILFTNILLLSASGFLSFQGSKDLVKIAAPKPEQLTSTKIDSAFAIRKMEVAKNFALDSATIASNYNQVTKTKEKYYNALIESQQNNYENYLSREQRTNKSYRSTKERIVKKIKKLEVEKESFVAAQEQEKSGKINALFEAKKGDLSKAALVHQSEFTNIQNQNTLNRKTAKSKTTGYGNFVAYFTIACLIVLVFCLTIDEINKKGSGIEQQALPNQYHFSDSISNELFNTIGNKWNHFVRSKIQNMATNIPPTLLPETPPVLYELGAMEQQRVKVALEAPEQSTIYLPSKGNHLQASQNKPASLPPSEQATKEIEKQATEYLRAAIELEKLKLFEQAKEMQLKADDVIKCYLGEEASPKKIKQLRGQIIGFLNNENENPFARHHQRKIGFKTAKTPDDKTPQTLLEHETRTVFVKDDKTIKHEDKNTGEIKHYALPQVKNFVSNYRSRVKETQKKYDKIPSAENLKVLNNRKESLDYWQGKKAILESRMGKKNG